jgi:hypothetical protein
MTTVVAVHTKRKKEIKPSSDSKVSGMKWNWLIITRCGCSFERSRNSSLCCTLRTPPAFFAVYIGTLFHMVAMTAGCITLLIVDYLNCNG